MHHKGRTSHRFVKAGDCIEWQRDDIKTPSLKLLNQSGCFFNHQNRLGIQHHSARTTGLCLVQRDIDQTPVL